MKQITCCAFDLETTALDAGFGAILCGVVKGDGQRPKVFRADKLNPDWGSNRADDSGVLAGIVSELSKYDIWVAHNGLRFDVPFLRTRLLKWDMPPLPTRKLVDPVQLARNKLCFRFNSLNAVAEHLKCNSKTPLTPDVWCRAALNGCRRSMNLIVKHCVEDVYTLEHVVQALKSYSTSINTYGSGF